jgi:hypothetical protein
MTERARRFGRLSAAEALRALYIDFEGGRDRPPVLLGTFRRGGRSDPHVHQVVLDPVFAAAGPETRDLHDAIETVVRRAERNDRRIVAWSEHELEMVRQLSEEHPDLVARFEARYANARALAGYWRNKVHGGDKPAENTLAAYLDLIGYDVPAGAGPGHVGETIRALRPTLEAGRPLTSHQQARWTRLLKHNQHDCAGMRAICLQATTELEDNAAIVADA